MDASKLFSIIVLSVCFLHLDARVLGDIWERVAVPLAGWE